MDRSLKSDFADRDDLARTSNLSYLGQLRKNPNYLEGQPSFDCDFDVLEVQVSKPQLKLRLLSCQHTDAWEFSRDGLGLTGIEPSLQASTGALQSSHHSQQPGPPRRKRKERIERAPILQQFNLNRLAALPKKPWHKLRNLRTLMCSGVVTTASGSWEP